MPHPLSPTTSIDFVAFGVIIDDIVFPDGRTAMGILGGGGPQTAFGMRLWSDAVGLTAALNQVDQELVGEWLRACAIDSAGLRFTELPTARAWQLMEEDGRRTQIWRIPAASAVAQLRRSLDYLPPLYRQAKGYHFGIHPAALSLADEPDLEFIGKLRQTGGLISIEPFKPADSPPPRQAMERLLSQIDIFSLNELEAASLVGGSEKQRHRSASDLAKYFLDAGASVVALRLGERGSLVIDGIRGQGYRVPAVPARVVDPVGAGNAYCGAFLTGFVQTGDLRTAAAYGAVAASFLVEQVGVPVCNSTRNQVIRNESLRRLNDLAPLIES